ncbi:MAG: hypothetical protein WB297_05105 [Actinomycetota bacterium]
MGSRWQRVGALGLAFAMGVLTTVVVVAVARSEPEAGPSGRAAQGDPASASPSVSSTASPSPQELLKIGGLPGAEPERTVDPLLMPYPFLSPTPPPSTRTVLDGTYLRTLTLRDVGGARIGLPFRCLRCPPYRVDAGVSTIMFWHGAFFLHHQMSDFKTQGSFVVDGDRVTLFNDPNCPQGEGVYSFEKTAHGLRFDVIHDDCPWSGERAIDLTRVPWTNVHVCVRWIKNLWPGAIAC